MIKYATTGVTLAALALASCTSNKPRAYSVQRGSATATPGNTPGNATAEAKPIEVVLDSTKLLEAPGPYDLEMSFSEGTGAPKVILKQQITPTAKNHVITLTTPPPTAAGLLTLTISQGTALKFIAKRSNAKFSEKSPLVIDDCLVLAAPWTGGQHDGSCEWTIEDVAN